MRYCHELLFKNLDNIAREHLQDLIAYHAYRCARDADDDWGWEWSDGRVVIRYRREDDAMLSARTLDQQHDLYVDVCGISGRLYQDAAVYTD